MVFWIRSFEVKKSLTNAIFCKIPLNIIQPCYLKQSPSECRMPVTCAISCFMLPLSPVLVSRKGTLWSWALMAFLTIFTWLLGVVKCLSWFYLTQHFFNGGILSAFHFFQLWTMSLKNLWFYTFYYTLSNAGSSSPASRFIFIPGRSHCHCKLCAASFISDTATCHSLKVAHLLACESDNHTCAHTYTYQIIQ